MLCSGTTPRVRQWQGWNTSSVGLSNTFFGANLQRFDAAISVIWGNATLVICWAKAVLAFKTSKRCHLEYPMSSYEFNVQCPAESPAWKWQASGCQIFVNQGTKSLGYSFVLDLDSKCSLFPQLHDFFQVQLLGLPEQIADARQPARMIGRQTILSTMEQEHNKGLAYHRNSLPKFVTEIHHRNSSSSIVTESRAFSQLASHNHSYTSFCFYLWQFPFWSPYFMNLTMCRKILMNLGQRSGYSSSSTQEKRFVFNVFDCTGIWDLRQAIELAVERAKVDSSAVDVFVAGWWAMTMPLFGWFAQAAREGQIAEERLEHGIVKRRPFSIEEETNVLGAHFGSFASKVPCDKTPAVSKSFWSYQKHVSTARRKSKFNSVLLDICWERKARATHWPWMDPSNSLIL